MISRQYKINYFLIFFIFICHLPKVHCQESESQNQSFEAQITIPFFVKKTYTKKVLKGKPQPDKNIETPKSSLRYIINAKTINAKISNNTITAHYENYEGKEKIDFYGTISKDKKMLLKLGINYTYIINGYPTEIKKGKFYVYNVPLKKMDKNLFKDLYRIKNIAENEEIFTGNYNKDTTRIEIESYSSIKQYNGKYELETWRETLIGDDPNYFERVLPVGWRITFTSSEESIEQGIVIKGNSTSYVGFVITELLKNSDLQVFDFTDEVSKKRELEASLKDICKPDHRDYALQIESNLKNPNDGEITVIIDETKLPSQSGLKTKVSIISKNGEKDLEFNLAFGQSETEHLSTNKTFFTQVQEIANEIKKLR